MKHKNLFKMLLLACMVAIGILKPTAALDISDLDNSRTLEAFVDGLVYPTMIANHSPSGTVSIVKDGRLIFTKGYGFQDIENHVRVDPEKTLFRPGSISKLFTWVAVMQMVEQGKLDLDVDVNTYITSFQIKDTFPGQPVTMRHIMTHTAGFEESSLGHLIIQDVTKALPLAKALAKYQPERVNPPGVQTAYSNYATSVAGLIVANLSGMEFADYIKEHIFDVLGMNSSSFKEPLPNNLNKDMAIAYAFDGARYVAKPFEIIANFSPAGALSSTATDMAKFAQAIMKGGQYNGARILSEDTTKQMLTRNFSHDDRMMGMALGFYETEQNGYRLIGHGGDTQFFHSELAIDVKNDIAIFSSFGGQKGAMVRDVFVQAFYDVFFPFEQEKLVRPADFAERAEKYAGTYIFWRSNFSNLEKAGQLSGGLSFVPTADNTLVLSGIGEFVEIDTNLFQHVNGTTKVAFQESSAGEITGFVFDGFPFMSTYKVPTVLDAGTYHLPLGLSLLLFLGVVLKRIYQRASYKTLVGAEKTVAMTSFIVAATNLLTAIMGGLIIAIVGKQLSLEIPMALKLWLVLPIIATVAGLYNLYSTFLVWRDGLFDSIWVRIRYSILALCGVFMCWFYYFWNILGFQYF